MTDRQEQEGTERSPFQQIAGIENTVIRDKAALKYEQWTQKLKTLTPEQQLALTAIAIDEAINEYHLENAASRDPLTGVLNRREFASRFDQAMLEFKRKLTAAEEKNKQTQTPGSILVVDLDYLKEANTRGLTFGDSILKAVTEALNESVRPGDEIARLGGDEFAVLLKDCGRKGAVSVAERIRKAIPTYTSQAEQLQGYQQTITIGVAPIEENVAAGQLESEEVRDQLYQHAFYEADQLLAHAKNRGIRDATIFKDSPERMVVLQSDPQNLTKTVSQQYSLPSAISGK